MKARDIFLQASEIRVKAERAAFLEHECGDDLDLRRRVSALLAAHDDPDSYLERPAAKFNVAETQDVTR